MPAILSQAADRSGLWVDKFVRPALGGCYSVVRGSADISSNQCEINTAATYNDVIGVARASSPNQWLYTKLSAGFSGSETPLWYLRFTDTGSPMYTLFYAPSIGLIAWQTKANTASAASGVTGASTTGFTLVDGDALAFTLSGIGTGTRLRGFRNPTRTAPLSAAHWDSGDTPGLDWTYVGGGGGAVDSGLGLGFGGYPATPNGIKFSEVRWGALSP